MILDWLIYNCGAGRHAMVCREAVTTAQDGTEYLRIWYECRLCGIAHRGETILHRTWDAQQGRRDQAMPRQRRRAF